MIEPADARGPDESAWTRISRYFGGQDHIALALAVLDLSSAERRDVATEVRRYVAPRSEEPFRRIDEQAVAVIGAGVLPDARSAARWLGKHTMSGVEWIDDPRSARRRPRMFDVVPQVFFALSRRGVDWLPELTGLLADRLPVGHAGEDPRFHLVVRLMAETGHPVPTGDGFVACWVAEHDPSAAVEAVVADPRLHVLVTRFFDVEAVGAMFDRDSRWADTVAELERRGLVARDVVLDACVRRLARGGKPGATRAYLGVHEALAPTDEEVAARVTGYLQLLDERSSTVAGMAQRRLSRVDDEGRLSDAHLLLAIERGFRRSEKKLVRASLADVRRAVIRDVSRRKALARVVAASLTHLPADLARDATAVLVGLDPAAAGGQDAHPGTGAPRAPASSQPRAMTAVARRVPLASITTLTQLVEETAAILYGPHWDPDGAQLWRVLDGLVRWGRSDPAGLREATATVRTHNQYGFRCEHHDSGYERDTGHGVADLLQAAIGEPDADVLHHARGTAQGGIEDHLVDLVYEIARLLRHTPAVRLVSLPSWTNGVLAAGELLARLQAAHVEGWEPWDADLDLALLRIAADGAEFSGADFGAIGSAAGRRAAEWIAADRPVRPVVDVIAEAWDYQVPYGQLRTGQWLQPRIVDGRSDPRDGATWAHLQQSCDRVRYAPACRVWPSLAPTCRELIAAQWLRTVGPPMSGDGADTRILVELADAEGGFGPAMAAALGYGLGRPAKRQAPAVEALLRLTAQEEFDAALFGATLARLSGLGALVPARLIDPLNAVADSGHGAVVWDVLRMMVGDLLTGGTAVTGMADLLDLGARLVEPLAARGRVEGLAAFAGRPGRTRQLTEARRLLGLLER